MIVGESERARVVAFLDLTLRSSNKVRLGGVRSTKTFTGLFERQQVVNSSLPYSKSANGII